MATIEVKYCKICNCGTMHRKLPQLTFVQQCAVAALTRFSVDLREPETECTECGTKT